MKRETYFVPKILLCGDEAEFISRIGQRPYEIVGHVEFRGAADGQDFDFEQDEKFLLDNKICNAEELTNMIRGGVIDFLVFNSGEELAFLDKPLWRIGCLRGQGISTEEFINLPNDNIHYLQADVRLMDLMKSLSIKTLLDVDAYLAKSLIITKSPNDLTEIDCICSEKIFPIKEDIFHHVYKDFSECSLRHYDAALISQNTPDDFDDAFCLLKDTANLVITFARNNSPLIKHLQDNKDNFKKVDLYPCTPSGQWIFCYRRTPPQDFAMYVVTHKLLPPEHIKLFPEKYKLINAGAATREEDLGCLRDDIGDNISDLNPYLNELTAFYWVWKNTSHTAIGFCHYRRFFQLQKDGNFLTQDEALKLLEYYDVLIRPVNLYRGTFMETRHAYDHRYVELVEFAQSVIRKNLMRTHPDYVEIFDHKMVSNPIYFNNSFVMRRNVFNAFCEWFFSFMIDSTREALNETNLAQIRNNTRRIMITFGETLPIVWLMKNRLRIKEVRFIGVDPFK